MWRSGFGPSLELISAVNTNTAKETWASIKALAAQPLLELQPSSSFVMDNYDKVTARFTESEKEAWNRKIRQQSNKDLKELNNRWIGLMVDSANQLGEKMSFFWHNHFAIRHANSFLQQDAINIIRRHAVGNFGDLLREVSKSGAMILSLNNQQNRKSSPNENFAREIMELFSMGIGHYSEVDIKEAARAFTGWSIGKDGRFVFRNQQHDTGIKNILGHKGRFNGDDVVDIILKQPQTATFIVSRIYRYFVNEDIDGDRIEQLATSFRKDYNIMGLLDQIFGSDWFYADQNMGNRIKSPIELLVGMQRFSPVTAIAPAFQNKFQKLLGQILFYPPSIAGWPSGKNWLDSTALMVRLQLPQVINGKVNIDMQTKPNDDANMGRENPDDMIQLRGGANTQLNSKWSQWASKLTDIDLAEYIIVPVINENKLRIIHKNKGVDNSNFIYNLMSLPEYQLC